MAIEVVDYCNQDRQQASVVGVAAYAGLVVGLDSLVGEGLYILDMAGSYSGPDKRRAETDTDLFDTAVDYSLWAA